MPKGIPKAKEENTLVPELTSEPEFATKEEINELKGTVLKIYDLLEEKKQTEKKEQESSENQESLPEANPIKPSWRKVVDMVLGPDYGINVSYTGGGGMIFRVIVPKSKSNATDAYFKLYKNDVRSKVIALGSNDADQIKQWCLKIKKNLSVKPKQI